jgi:spermidine synthase
MIYQRLKQHFAKVSPYGLYIPLYGAYWSFALCSNELDPTQASVKEIAQRIELHELVKLNYYNEATHHGLFALPGYFRDLLR